MVVTSKKSEFQFRSHLFVWRWSIVGITDQFINAKVEYDVYTRYVVELHSHVLRLNHRWDGVSGSRYWFDLKFLILFSFQRANQSTTTDSINQTHVNDDLAINCLRISHIDDLNMVLLRYWSIIESIYHTIDLACLFKMWTNKGKKKLNEFLADLGWVLFYSNFIFLVA